MKNPFFLILPFLLLSFSTYAQSTSEFERTFEFDEESSESEFVIEVNPGTDALLFNVISMINSGDLDVSLVSPSGKKEGGFRLQTSKGKVKTKVKTKSKEKAKGYSNSNSNSNSNSSSTTTTTTVTTGEGNGESYVEVNTDASNGYSYSSSSTSNTSSKGNMNKTISNPETGTWKVIIVPKGVNGKLKVAIQHRVN